MCDNCGTTQGPFTYIGWGKRVCAPVEFDKKGKLIGRVVNCAARRKAMFKDEDEGEVTSIIVETNV